MSVMHIRIRAEYGTRPAAVDAMCPQRPATNRDGSTATVLICEPCASVGEPVELARAEIAPGRYLTLGEQLGLEAGHAS